MRVLLLSFVLLLFSCKVQQEQAVAEEFPQVQSALDILVSENNIPGLNVSFYKDKRLSNFSTGFSDVNEQRYLTADHKLLSGSIGKTYLVPLIDKLIKMEKLQLSDRLIDYLSDINWISRIPNIEDITIRQLLSHTSGLPRWVMDEDVWKQASVQPDKIWSYEDRMRFIFDTDAIHAAGESWAYSDTNYLFLGMLIEKLFDRPYYDIIKSEVLNPLGLINTIPSDQRKIHNLTQAYSELPETFYIPNEVIGKQGYVFNPQLEWTGGGMASTTGDLATWCHHYYTGNSISENMKQEIIAVTEHGEKCFGDHSYGMGSFVYNTKFGKAYGHTGFMPGFNSIMIYYPTDKIAIAVQANCDYASRNMSLVNYTERILEAVNVTISH
jgi:D-alanyl-D-alanine carboxypeptidase